MSFFHLWGFESPPRSGSSPLRGPVSERAKLCLIIYITIPYNHPVPPQESNFSANSVTAIGPIAPRGVGQSGLTTRAVGSGPVPPADPPSSRRNSRPVTEPNYRHKLSGRSFRLDTLQAAVLPVKLRYLDRWIRARQAREDTYGWS